MGLAGTYARDRREGGSLGKSRGSGRSGREVGMGRFGASEGWREIHESAVTEGGMRAGGKSCAGGRKVIRWDKMDESREGSVGWEEGEEQ